ncbi:Taurine dioxygenase, alpha-ketoglutarate-dependent [Streptoalloteichus tenebrarius]|uniref:Taurine dioxygenase, alpha-ketoglutarate-dependent n=1 Tax=Streptoalloteichus tenebrarius (strain ATCC 17920 / DSM 40477 / JCM 4838 / CBS 697.72 / NBRC 16177 / NCIMB 11028 / NRRL B-12390 / A12253. 1 / ISP 5477) TaxID=1933 RepID=A0ABT1HLN3_STRSD|nr:TauD/TfdA family dioxygenase [Streptoalloteichus tenebrarius]MCP2256427.1 Taurine dioxygenase, alpha-ketoglutarate-dependent [Streptoalloteichus tenebrarius]BFF04778.1 TauD/TfdA family dioxygenase [Streptoalloteichus tenebrarius]
MTQADTGAFATLPLVITGDSESVHERIRRDRERIRAALTRHGAVLLRGFAVGGVEGFDQVVRELSGTPLTYSERSTPRSRISGNVYTSTDYPPQEEIFAHNENSYQAVWPLTLYFYCVEPPLTQGATPLASTREIHASIDPEIREEFERRKWMVVRNYSDELGMPWQESFNTDDRAEVDAYCERNGIRTEWLGGDRLRTRAVREPVHRHPVTGERVWFNHATFFHVSTLPEEIRTGLLEMCGEENLPNNTYYGDGGVIPDDVMDHLRACYRAASTRFDYERDDVLVVDNMLSTHAREPFTGPRRIAVAMAEPSSAV